MSYVQTIILHKCPHILWDVRHSLTKEGIPYTYSFVPKIYTRKMSTYTLSKIPNNIEKSYYNPISQRELIRKDNNGNTGVYPWENKLNNKVYTGSGDPLCLRISHYYQSWYITITRNL